MKAKVFILSIIILRLLQGESTSAQEYRYTNTLFQGYTKTTGIVYGTAPFLNAPYINESATTTQNLVLDLYQPLGDTLSHRPLIIFAHSGGFMTGSRTVNDMVALCDTFARKGYVTATIDYRQGLEIADNADLHYTRAAYRGLQDGRTAVRYLKSKATQYGIDPDHVYFGGSSAGAFICLNAIYMDTNELPTYLGQVNYTAFLVQYSGPGLGKPDIGPNLEFSGTPGGVMGCWGGVGDTLTINTNNPTPVFLVHGTADQTVPFNSGPPFGYGGLSDVFGSHAISIRLTGIGIPAKETYFVTGQGHEFWGTSNGNWSNGTGGNAYWDTIVRKATTFFWDLHKPEAGFNATINGMEVDFTDQSQGSTAWKWEFGDGATATIQNPVHVYGQTGTYHVRQTVRNAIQSWDTINHSIVVSGSTALSEPDLPTVNIYPIPASEILTIDIDHGLKPDDFEVSDVFGRIMEKKSNLCNVTTRLDLTGWSNGIYFIRIHFGDRFVNRKLVVKHF
ncbi:MAG: PKD domain-containing protein [Bacteroidota bacterium]